MALIFPSKLYGREAASAELLQRFDRVKTTGTPELLLISGQPGVGKTEIASHGQTTIARQHACWVAAGKCDRLQHNVPYAAIVTAFRTLTRHILDQAHDKNTLLKHLTTALGSQGQIVVNVIPEVEQLLGKQPPIAPLGAVETQNRFHLVWGNFIRSFCSPDTPLVLVLDDLQWADPATLKLLQRLLTDPETRYLFCVGTYRSNEVGPNHPLTRTMETLQTAGTAVQRLQLEALSDRQVGQLVADTLHDDSERARSLADWMFRQTAGNPLWLKQSLYNLYLNKHLFQETGSGIWRWQLEHLPNPALFEIVAQRLAQLPAQTHHLLKRAACIGGRISLLLLAAMGEQSPFKTLLQLRPALRSGLIAIVRESAGLVVCFAHDRIQQRVYDLIEPATRTAMHLATGQLLQAANTADHFFLMVNQLNLGARLISSPAKTDDLCRLNLKAAQNAREVADFASALTYIHQCLQLLGESWQRNYALTLEIHQEAIETEYLNGHFEQSHRLSATALENTNTVLDEISVYQLKIQAYIAQVRYKAAVDLGLSVLKNIGIELHQELPEDLSVEALENLPETVELLKISTLKLLCTISDFAPLVEANNFASMLITEVNLYWQMGNSNLSAMACVDYAFLLCAMGDIEQGNQYGELALRLLKRFDLKRLHCKVINIYHCGVKHWIDLKQTLPGFESAIAIGIEYGDLDFVGHATLNYCTHSFFAGINLAELEKIYGQHTKILEKFRLSLNIQLNKIFNQVTLNLGRATGNAQLKGSIFDAEILLPDLRAENNTFALFLTYLGQGILSYFFEEYATALNHLEEATAYAAVMSGFATTTQLNFYHSLAILGYYRSAPPSERPALAEKVVANQRQMAAWSQSGPMNFLHKFQLVEAERDRILGDRERAESFYLQAILGAANQGYTHEDALANELLGRYYFSCGQKELGKQKLIRARELYVLWGAIAIVMRLEQQHQWLQGRRVATSNQAIVDYFVNHQLPENKMLLKRCRLRYTDRKIVIGCPDLDMLALIKIMLPTIEKPSETIDAIEIALDRDSF